VMQPPPSPAPMLRPLRIGEILDVAIKVYTRHALDMFKLVVLLVAPVQIIGALVLISTTPDASFLDPAAPFDPADPNQVPQVDMSELWAAIAGSIVVWLLNLIASILATAACFHAISSAYLGAPVEWRQSLSLATKRLPSLLWLTFLTTVALLLGFLACIVPGVWLWVSFTVAVPALLAEGLRGSKALQRSYNLVKGRWWPTLGALLIGFVIAMIITSIFGAILAFVSFTDIGENIAVTAILNSLANLIASVLVTPFQAAVVAILYFDLRVRKEGFDLQLMASRIGIGPPTEPGLIPAGYPAPGPPPGAWQGGPPPPPPPSG
jgi:hypothetical protein